MARLDRLSTVKDLAQTGSVIGREFSHDLLRAVAAISDEQLSSGLGRLIDAVTSQAAALMSNPDGPDVISSRYGITVEKAKAWFDTTEFAPRQSMDPTIGPAVLDALGRAGLG